MTVPARTFRRERANRYSYVLTVTGVRVACAACGCAGAYVAAAATTASPTARIAALRKRKRIDDVAVAGVPLLVAVAPAASLEHSDVLLPIRLVRNPRRAERDLDPGRVVPELRTGLRVVGAVGRVRRAFVTDEDETARGRQRGVVAVAGRRHPHGPGDLVRRHVDRLEVAASERSLIRRPDVAEALDAAVSELRAEVRLARDPRRKLRLRVGLERGVAVVAADVLEVRSRVVTGRLPVGAALGPGRVRHEPLRVVGHEDAADLVRLPVGSFQELPCLR